MFLLAVLQTAKFAQQLRLALKESNWDAVVSILATSDDAAIASKYVGEEVADAQQALHNANSLELLVEALSRDEGRLSEAGLGEHMNVASVDVLDVAIEASTEVTSALVGKVRVVAEGVRDLRLAVLNKQWHAIATAIEKAGTFPFTVLHMLCMFRLGLGCDSMA